MKCAHGKLFAKVMTALLPAAMVIFLIPAASFAASTDAAETTTQQEGALSAQSTTIVQSDDGLQTKVEDALANNLGDAKDEITVTYEAGENLTGDALNSILTRVQEICFSYINENPEFFYVSGEWDTTGEPVPRTNKCIITITPHYSKIVEDKTAFDQAKKDYEDALDDCVSWVPNGATNMEKAKAVHDWLVRKCAYNSKAVEAGSADGFDEAASDYWYAWSAYGALVEYKPVCEGYSRAFVAAMKELGIDCATVGSDDHMWNSVKIDGALYHVDVTWDDPLVNGKDQGFSSTPSAKFFLKSDAYWKTNHVGSATSSGDESLNYVEIGATSTKYDNASFPTFPDIVSSKTTVKSIENLATGLKITWNKNTSASGYKVYRSTNGKTYSLATTITKNTTLSYADKKANTNAMKYTYKVIAYKNIGSTTYEATSFDSKAYYRIARPAIKTLANSASKKLTVKWAKNAKSSGYQVRYKLSSAKSWKTVKVAKASSVSKVIGSLKKGKTYNVQVRSYKTVSKVTYYSAWSKTKSKKITK